MGFIWQMLKPIVVDVITTGQLFTLGLVLRCLTEPHPKCVTDGICHTFLFRDGLLTLMYKASLMVLKRL